MGWRELTNRSKQSRDSESKFDDPTLKHSETVSLKSKVVPKYSAQRRKCDPRSLKMPQDHRKMTGFSTMNVAPQQIITSYSDSHASASNRTFRVPYSKCATAGKYGRHDDSDTSTEESLGSGDASLQKKVVDAMWPIRSIAQSNGCRSQTPSAPLSKSSVRLPNCWYPSVSAYSPRVVIQKPPNDRDIVDPRPRVTARNQRNRVNNWRKRYQQLDGYNMAVRLLKTGSVNCTGDTSFLQTNEHVAIKSSSDAQSRDQGTLIASEIFDSFCTVSQPLRFPSEPNKQRLVGLSSSPDLSYTAPQMPTLHNILNEQGQVCFPPRAAETGATSESHQIPASSLVCSPHLSSSRPPDVRNSTPKFLQSTQVNVNQGQRCRLASSNTTGLSRVPCAEDSREVALPLLPSLVRAPDSTPSSTPRRPTLPTPPVLVTAPNFNEHQHAKNPAVISTFMNVPNVVLSVDGSNLQQKSQLLMSTPSSVLTSVMSSQHQRLPSRSSVACYRVQHVSSSSSHLKSFVRSSRRLSPQISVNTTQDKSVYILRSGAQLAAPLAQESQVHVPGLERVSLEGMSSNHRTCVAVSDDKVTWSSTFRNSLSCPSTDINHDSPQTPILIDLTDID